jgi:hypothetical protein
VDTAAQSLYARSVKRWIWVGHENGARIAALVAYKNPRLRRSAFVFLSYPLMEPAPPPPKQKAGAEPPADSFGPLVRLIEGCTVPILFVNGELDYNCPGADLKTLTPRLADAGVDGRAVILPDLDAHFAAPGASAATAGAISEVLALVERWVKAVEEDTVASSDFPTLEKIVPSLRVPPRPPPVEAEEEEAEPSPPPPPPLSAVAAPQARPNGSAPSARPGFNLGQGMQFNPAAAQQMLLLQQQMMVRQQQQQQQAAGGGMTAASQAASQQQQLQLQMQLQMAMMQQQMAAAAAAGRPALPQQVLQQMQAQQQLFQPPPPDHSTS